jgi:hypothetical protein
MAPAHLVDGVLHHLAPQRALLVGLEHAILVDVEERGALEVLVRDTAIAVDVKGGVGLEGQLACALHGHRARPPLGSAVKPLIAAPAHPIRCPPHYAPTPHGPAPHMHGCAGMQRGGMHACLHACMHAVRWQCGGPHHHGRASGVLRLLHPARATAVVRPPLAHPRGDALRALDRRVVKVEQPRRDETSALTR